jgi:glutamyl-tRNA reductase
MYCYYTDHHCCSNELELAKLSLEHKNKPFNPKLGMALLTCHRVEYYPSEELSSVNLKELPSSHRYISDSLEAKRRLLRIATGLESKILGEKAIYFQVEGAINSFLSAFPKKNGFTAILAYAKSIRENFNFYAPAHGGLIYDYISQGESDIAILIGAGMLNQSIVRSNSRNKKYSKILLVTRDTKRAKKRLRGYLEGVEILKPDMLRDCNLSQKFDLIIATDNIESSYEMQIKNLETSKLCNYVVDISSCPLTSLNSSSEMYYSLYTRNTEILVKKSNLFLRKKIAIINSYINKLEL